MLEEIDISLCVHKLGQDGGVTPDQVKPYVPTALAWDNIDRLEEPLTGRGTSHRVNGIAVQPRMLSPRCGPPTRSYVEVKTDICADALKNSLWLQTALCHKSKRP